jgi:predicted O-methyltransferase YrrM
MAWPAVSKDVHPTCTLPEGWWNPEPFDKSMMPPFMQQHPFFNLDVIPMPTLQDLQQLAARAVAFHGKPDVDLRPEWLRAMNSDLREPYYSFLHMLPAHDERLRKMLEIGTRTGAGALHFAAGHPHAQVTTIDIDPAVGPHVQRLAAEHNVMVSAVTADSSKLWNDAKFLGDRRGSYDVLLVDGDHTYVSSLGDARAFAPLLRPGGILLFDDTRLHEGMTRAWNELSGGEKLEMPELHYMGFGVMILPERALADNELRYRPSSEPLQVGECSIYDNPYKPGHWLMSFRYIRITDGKPETRAIPVNPNAGPTDRDASIGLTWGLQRVGPGKWQISPSIKCLDTIPDPANPDKNVEVEVWHQVPAVLDVPDSEPWTKVHPR